MKSSKVHSVAAVDLFCGVGGMTHGLERAGVRVVAGYDNDKNCEYPYAYNNNSRFEHVDVWELGAAEILDELRDAEVTIVAGCPPCQPFSTYSQSARKSRANEDWQLVRKFAELARDVRPDYVIMENVPSVVNHPVFVELQNVLEDYELSWEIVNVERLGVPQSRRRLVFVGALKGLKGSVDLSVLHADRTPVTVYEAIGQLPMVQAGQKNEVDPLHVAAGLSLKNLERIQASRPGGTWRDWPPRLLAECHRRSSGASYPSVYGRMHWDRPSPTITTQCFGFGNGRFGHPVQDRAITLREAAILQSFPTSYSFVPDGVAVRFSQVGRWIGNAVPVKLAENVGKLVLQHLEG